MKIIPHLYNTFFIPYIHSKVLYILTNCTHAQTHVKTDKNAQNSLIIIKL